MRGYLTLHNLPVTDTPTLCREVSSFRIALCGSSIRYKTNVNTLGAGLALIRRLRPVTYNWRTDNTPSLGLVAEEVAAVEPLLATYNKNGEVEGVKYDRVGVILINAVNEQQAQIEAQKEKNDLLERQVQQQRREIDTMKKVVCELKPEAAFCK